MPTNISRRLGFSLAYTPGNIHNNPWEEDDRKTYVTMFTGISAYI